jgi:hypothetical protein
LAFNAYSLLQRFLCQKWIMSQWCSKDLDIYINIYLVDFTSEDANLRTCLFTKASLGWLWHRRLAHVGMSTLKKVLKKDMVRRVKDVLFEKDKPCNMNPTSQQHRGQQYMNPTSQQQDQSDIQKHIKPSPGQCIVQYSASSRLTSTNRLHQVDLANWRRSVAYDS